MVKMNKEGMKKIKKWREKIVVDGVLLDAVRAEQINRTRPKPEQPDS
jgi:hypothetical protein